MDTLFLLYARADLLVLTVYRVQRPECMCSLVQAVAASATLASTMLQSKAGSTQIASRAVILPVSVQLKYLSLVQKRLVLLVSISHRPLCVRRAALDGYLQLSSSLLQPFFEDLATDALASSEAYLDFCNVFLADLVRLDFDFAYLPQDGSYAHSGEARDDTTKQWTRLVQSVGACKHSDLSSDALGVKFKTHLVCMLPVAVRLSSLREFPALQQTAKALLAAADLPGLLTTFATLNERALAAEAENVLLKTEVIESCSYLIK